MTCIHVKRRNVKVLKCSTLEGKLDAEKEHNYDQKTIQKRIEMRICQCNASKQDAAFLLTVGSFLLTVELFYLQLAIKNIFAFSLTVGAFFAYNFSFFTYSSSFFTYSGKVRLIRALRDCK